MSTANQQASLLVAMSMLSLLSPALAQGVPTGSAGNPANLALPVNVLRDSPLPNTTILQTDVMPLPTIQNRMTFAENLQLRILQKLPARSYFTASCETSFRYETNVFQFPTKRTLLKQLNINAAQWASLNAGEQKVINDIVKLASSEDTVFRVLPAVTAGITVTPHTRLYGTFFTIRDSLCKNVRLNTNIYSYGYGIQHDFKLGARANLQADLQFRELNQMHQHSVFDFLPGLTFSYVVNPRTVAYANALLQIRGRKYFQAPTRELDPFYTWGLLHQRGRWSFSASTTFVQNFREPFKHQALIPVNNYSFISDFEIARRIFPQLSGLQAFIRAEPIWNFHSNDRPGLSGMDFRLYYGLRMAVSKPSLTGALDSLRRQLEEQEIEPPKAKPQQTKPSAFIRPEELAAQNPQPMHGFLTANDEPVSDTQVFSPSRATIESAKVATSVSVQ